MPQSTPYGPQRRAEEPLQCPQPGRSRPGRISGTALPFGVHLSNGAYGSASNLHLIYGGANILGLGAIALVITYIETWLVQTFVGVPLPAYLLGVTAQVPGPDAQVWSALINILPFVNFLLILRMSSLAGYHAAEHKVVTTIERYGYATYELAKEMPRVHPRCGTVLLLGILPVLLVAIPLLYIEPVWALVVAIVGWFLRYHTGFFVQNYFTTKTPTPKQLKAGLHAGNTLLERWREDPHKKVPWLKSLWIRGIPQMVIGLVIMSRVLSLVYDHLHIWLDF
ncbi:MAG: DUF1385 domain-containing protein [Armatimonadota bacterium]